MAVKLKTPKLIKHRTPQSVLAAHWHIPWRELKRSTMGGVDVKGKESEHSFTEIVDGIKLAGFWGFADPKKREIHIWVSRKAKPKDVMFFLGHELGHVTGKPIKERGFKTMKAEEDRADGYGIVAAQAFEWVRNLVRI